MEKLDYGTIIGKELKAILPSDKEDGGTVSYYRGQQGLNYLLLPKAMRVNKTSENKLVADYEYKVTNTLIVDFPEEFYRVSPLIRLSRIEHLDLPSRLVNISASPLNALFFSCNALDKKTHNEDPYIFRYDIPSIGNEMRSFDSDTGKILTALSMLKSEQQSNLRHDAVMDYMFQIYGYIIADKYRKQNNVNAHLLDKIAFCYRCVFQIIMDDCLKNLFDKATFKNIIYNGLKQYGVEAEVADKVLNSIEWIRGRGKILVGFKFMNYEDDGDSRECIGTFNLAKCNDYYGKEFQIIYPVDWNTDELKNTITAKWFEEQPMLYANGGYASWKMNDLHWKIVIDYPYFLQVAKPTSILNGIFVQPTMSSERMIVQQGAFMLYGLSAFWNVQRTIRYLLCDKTKYTWKDIIGILVSEDMSFLKARAGKPNLEVPYHDTVHRSKLIKFLKAVQHVTIIKINEEPSRLREALNAIGVTKSSSGRTPEMSIANLNEILGL